LIVKKEKVERTVVIVKPDAIERRLVGKVIARIEALGLKIGQIKRKKLTPEECRKFYPKTRKNLPKIYAAVEKLMTENFSIVFIAEGEDAIKKVITIKGPTDLLSAPKGTIRRDFVTDKERKLHSQGKSVRNVMHAPDDKAEAEFEIELLFGKMEE